MKKVYSPSFSTTQFNLLLPTESCLVSMSLSFWKQLNNKLRNSGQLLIPTGVTNYFITCVLSPQSTTKKLQQLFNIPSPPTSSTSTHSVSNYSQIRKLTLKPVIIKDVEHIQANAFTQTQCFTKNFVFQNETSPSLLMPEVMDQFAIQTLQNYHQKLQKANNKETNIAKDEEDMTQTILQELQKGLNQIVIRTEEKIITMHCKSGKIIRVHEQKKSPLNPSLHHKEKTPRVTSKTNTNSSLTSNNEMAKEKMDLPRKCNPSFQHDDAKNYLIRVDNCKQLLSSLSMISNDGTCVLPSMYDKYKQINHFLLIVSKLKYIQEYQASSMNVTPGEDCEKKLNHKKKKKKKLRIIDCGCGKAYLSFALFYWMKMQLGMDVELIGIDRSEQIIAFCQETAKSLFPGELEEKSIQFICGTIEKQVPSLKNESAQYDHMIVALHACNTASDDALHLSIELNANVVLCAPCCHHHVNQQLKQNKKEMLPTLPIEVQMMMHNGITRERFADLLTDSIRSEILNIFGFKSSIIEFISPEHSMKNLMICAEKKSDTPKIGSSLEKVKEVVSRYHIRHYLLEKILDG